MSNADESIDWLPDAETRAVRAIVEAVVRGAGEKLVGVALVGAWVPPVRPTVAERVELLVAVKELPLYVLGNLAHQVRQRAEAEAVGLTLMTDRELLRATDVFALELADYAARHHMIHGRDPLGDLHVTPGQLRLALERRLRFLARDVRETMLTGAWQNGRLVDVASALRAALGQILVVADHLARLAGAVVAGGEAELLRSLCERSEVAPEPLLAMLKRLAEGEAFEQPVSALGELLELVEGATRLVDAMGVADSLRDEPPGYDPLA